MFPKIISALPRRRRGDEGDSPQAGKISDLLLAQDYISDLAVYRRSLVEAVGWLRPELTWAEFYDLALRATAATRAERVLHVPAILYHRHSENQTTRQEKALPGLRTIRAARRAVREHLDALGNWKTLLRPAPQAPSSHRVIWPIPEPAPLVSVIVPTRDWSDHLEQLSKGFCIERTIPISNY